MNAVQELSIQVIQEHFKTKLKPIAVKLQGKPKIYIIKYFTHLIEVNPDHTIVYRNILCNKTSTGYWKSLLENCNESTVAECFARHHAAIRLYSLLKKHTNRTVASIEDPKYHECLPPRRTNNHKAN